MNHLERLGDRIEVRIEPDKDGYVGRECPQEQCGGYFKITLGTGLSGDDLTCYCPYCGHKSSPDYFYTKDQVEHAISVGLNLATSALIEDLKDICEDMSVSTGLFSMTYDVRGEPHPIHYYRERCLETEVVCDRCSLRYAIYGVFAFCPDCGSHNSIQILTKNLDLYEKLLDVARSMEPAVAEHLIGNSLEDAVAAFDGFGRETCRVRASFSSEPAKSQSVSFQNLAKAKSRVQELFGIDLSASVMPDEWNFACRCFQKRHLLAHSMGVVDEAYIQATQDTAAVAGRKIVITPDQVLSLIGLLRKMGVYLLAHSPVHELGASTEERAK